LHPQIHDQAGLGWSMNRRNSSLLLRIVLLSCAQIPIGWPALEYEARANVPVALVCNEAPQGLDENDMAAICEARMRAEAERENCAQNISCKHEWRDVIDAWEDQRARISNASRK
jgi:hypothetical protein